MRLSVLFLLLVRVAFAQQYAGDQISALLPTIPGAEVAFFKIPDPAGANDHLTLVNYYALGSDGQRIKPSKIQRAVIVVHGLLRDPWNYQTDVSMAGSLPPPWWHSRIVLAVQECDDET